MFNSIIRWSLAHKFAVLACAALVAVAGVWSLSTMAVDILPDINKPAVAVFAESPGMAPEDVERSLLIPLESVLAGAPGVERIRGNAAFAQATVNIEFAWGTDLYRNRQIVEERLSQAALPPGVTPVLGPSTSLLGEILWVGMTSENAAASPMQLRTLADLTVRPALLRVPGVANVLVMGGDVREWQIELNAERMRREGIMIDDVRRAVADTLANKSGNALIADGKEYPIRIIGAPTAIDELGTIALRGKSDNMNGASRVVRLGDIAAFREGPSLVRGSGSIDGKAGVILRVIRQPDAETLAVTDAVDVVITGLVPSMPEGVAIESDLFRQERFIRAGLANVASALRDGTLLVVLILFLFLLNMRTTAITLTAIPLSVLATAIVFKQFGLSVNVMTLGGIAVAVGELVDDAIVDVENIFRRLRELRASDRTASRDQVVFRASAEVRNSIVYATALVVVAFLPVFLLPGLEGRLLASLAAAYLVALAASMLVSLSVTPVLASLLLSPTALAGHREDTRLVTVLKSVAAPAIRWCVERGRYAVVVIVTGVVLSSGAYFALGKEGIPPFNEGSAVVMLFLPPGTALSETVAHVERLERALLEVPGVARVSSIAGRAPADPHGGSVNSSEVQIAFADGAFEHGREKLFADLQAVLDRFGGADHSLGQPVTHRVEMLLSGVRAPIVVKVFGDDQTAMESAAALVARELARAEGVANVRIQQNTVVPEFRIHLDPARLSEAGVSAGEAARDLEMGLMGERLGIARLNGAPVEVVARFDVESKGSISALRDLALPYSSAASLGSIADLRLEGGRNAIDHEGTKRVLAVTANYAGRDIAGAVDAARKAIEQEKLPVGVTLSFEGNAESQKQSSRRLLLAGLVGLAAIFGILFAAFRSVPLAAIVMANVPLAVLGGMAGVFLSGGTISIAHLVGFVSLAGIVSRNGIMLIGRAITLASEEGGAFTSEIAVRAALDRLTPVLMTSLVTALALVPLILAGGEPGKEMLHPLATVLFGGLAVGTIASLALTPALLLRYGKQAPAQRKETSGL